MPSSGKISGTLTKITVGGVEISNLEKNSFELTRNFRTVSTKDSGDWEEFLPARKSGNISGSVIFAPDATYGFDEMFTAWDAGTVITYAYTTGVTGDKELGGSAYFESISRDDTDQENVTLDFTIKPTGAIGNNTIA